MPRKAKPARTAPAPDHSLHDLALDAFGLFGAKVVPARQGALHVTLTPDLAEHFGKPDLQLVFSAAHVSPFHDLMAYGSRAFDRLMGYITNHGSLIQRALPERYPDLATRGLPAGLSLVNCQTTRITTRRSGRWLCQFNFHLSFRADDKREELFAVALDEAGQVIADWNALLEQSQPAPADSETARHDTLAVLAEEARRRAIYHADQQCAAIEQEILPRLHKTLARLVSYYEEQALEIQERSDEPGRAEEQRAQLRTDLQRKMAEEVENHRLRITVTLFSMAQLEEPVWEHVLHLRQQPEGDTVRLPVVRSLFTGALEPPQCHVCDAPTLAVGLCAHGHITCRDCLARCHACARDLCLDCGLQGCSSCKELLCDDCAVVCHACGQWACTQHSARCPVCQETTCFTCQDVCAGCGARQCRGHLVADHLATAHLLCSRCAITCPHCARPSAQTATCDYCGQVFCQACVQRCVVCDGIFCLTHVVPAPLEKGSICKRCLVACPHCGTEAIKVNTCATCGREGCRACQVACAECGTMLCLEHGHICYYCHQPYCDWHIDHCLVDDEVVCSAHALACPGCDRTVCPQHRQSCAVCTLDYCPDCVDRENRVCHTCQQLEEAEPVDLHHEPIGADADVAALADRYTWRSVRNRHYTIYHGSRLLQHVTLVATHEGQLLRTQHHRRAGRVASWLRSLLG